MQRRKQHIAAAEGYLTLSMPDHALRELERIDQPRMCLIPYYRTRAEALRQLGRHEEALQSYGRVLAEVPNDILALVGMAWCYKRLGRIGKAISATEQAYRVDAKNPLLLYNLACYYSLAGQREQALSWLGRALRMRKSLVELVRSEPDFEPLREDAGFIFLIDGVESADRFDPDSPP